MKKNNRGFTLVELLAAIIILGILAVFAIPLIMSLMEKSKDKMYVDDAKKLISEVEYIVRSNKLDVELPDSGECIIISLDDEVVNNTLFENAPNGGIYEKTNSFVKVELGTDNKYKYSVRLIEELKTGGLKGIDLTKEENLKVNNAGDLVTNFSQSAISSNTHTMYGCKPW